MISPRRGFITTLLSLNAAVLSDRVLYQEWLVPQIQQGLTPTTAQWFLVFSPVMVAMLLASALVGNPKELLQHTLCFSVAWHGYEALASSWLMPGHLKSSAWEDPLWFWSVDLIKRSCFCALCLGAPAWLRLRR